MKKSIMTGAVILMTANIISKILGAVLKIPLTYIIHEEGMAVYNTAFSVYVMFLSFVISGMPFAVQKLTAEAHAKNDPGRAREIVRLATIALAVVGACGTAVMWFGADFFALAMK
ncbi:MAG: oligosaccharide flippase family protein, partial [Oscillospiraceae bacterium]|nr:oligosaccharide flippase family protein [Oscillospiraceae bacterium]